MLRVGLEDMNYLELGNISRDSTVFDNEPLEYLCKSTINLFRTSLGIFVDVAKRIQYQHSSVDAEIQQQTRKLETGAGAGIAIGVLAIAVLLAAALIVFKCKRNRKRMWELGTKA